MPFQVETLILRPCKHVLEVLFTCFSSIKACNLQAYLNGLVAKNGKNRNEKSCLKRNILKDNKLQTSLISRVFATNFEVGNLHASFERHFVKKIQHLRLLYVAYQQFDKCCFLVAFGCMNIIL